MSIATKTANEEASSEDNSEKPPRRPKHVRFADPLVTQAFTISSNDINNEEMATTGLYDTMMADQTNGMSLSEENIEMLSRLILPGMLPRRRSMRSILRAMSSTAHHAAKPAQESSRQASRTWEGHC